MVTYYSTHRLATTWKHLLVDLVYWHSHWSVATQPQTQHAGLCVETHMIIVNFKLFSSVFCRIEPDRLPSPPHANQWPFVFYDLVTGLLVVLTFGSYWPLHTHRNTPTSPAVLELLWPSRLAITVWSLSKSLRTLCTLPAVWVVVKFGFDIHLFSTRFITPCS